MSKLVPMSKAIIGKPIYMDSRPKGQLIYIPDLRPHRKSGILVDVRFVAKDVEDIRPGDIAVLQSDFTGAELTLVDDDGEEGPEELTIVWAEHVIAVMTKDTDDRPGIS